MPRPPLAAKSESPNTTTRVSGFGASSAAFRASAGVASATAADTAAPMTTGPFLSPFASSSATWPVASSALMSVSAQLAGSVSMNGCAVWPLTPPDHRRRLAGQRIRGEEVEALA